MYAFDLGCIAYQRAFEIQQKAQDFVLCGGDDILLLAGYFLELNRTRLGFRSLRLSALTEQAL